MANYSHHHAHMRERDRLEGELKALEEKAGRPRAARRLRRIPRGPRSGETVLFCSEQRSAKKLIAQSRRLRMHGREYSKAQLADAQEDLDAIETPGFRTPWVVPALVACAAILSVAAPI